MIPADLASGWRTMAQELRKLAAEEQAATLAMTLAERLRAMAAYLPSDAASVVLTRADLLALVEGFGDESTQTYERDLPVEEVAELAGRSTSTVRGWLSAGKLRGYKLHRRDWRVPRAALTEFLSAQAASSVEDCPTEGIDVDIGAWRRVGGA